MVNDVNLADYTGTQFNIIGNTSNPFKGFFDGNGYSISNFTYSTTSNKSIGIFGRVEHRNSLIRNVRLINPDIYSEYSGNTVGTLVAVLRDAVISCCSSEGGQLIAEHCGGGLVGFNWNGTIIDSYSTTDVTEVDIFMKPDYFAGLAAKNSGYIINCYSAGCVTASPYSERGGLVASNTDTVLNSFWDTQTSTQPTSDGGIGKTTVQMQDPNTFLDAGWDFVGEFENGPSDIWAEPNGGGYMILWFQLSSLPPLPHFTDGTGEANDPYLISTSSELNKIGHNPRLMTKHFKLVDNIDFTGVDFFPIGNPGNRFSGVFDGNNHTVSNFTYNSSVINRVGFFKYVVGTNSEIKDLGLIPPDVNAGTLDYVGSMVGQISYGSITNCWSDGGSITGGDFVGGLVGLSEFGNIYNSYSSTNVMGDKNVGGLCGCNSRGTVSNCYTEGSMVEARLRVGGVVGLNSAGEVSNCYAAVSVIGETSVGGLVGFNALGIVINSYSESSVAGKGDYRNKIGGLVGENYDGTASNCYASGNVTGYDNLGGLLGYNFGSITNCYATASVSGSGSKGGLVGYNVEGSIISASFWDVNSSGLGVSDGGIPKTTAEMQTRSTFTDAGWDFVGETANGTDDVWVIRNGLDYPKLVWTGYYGGHGTQENPYEIWTAGQMNEIGANPNDWDAHFVLMNDINMADYTYTTALIAPVIFEEDSVDFGPVIPFTGVFDGNSHTIEGLTIEGQGGLGLFGVVYEGGEVTNLGMVDVNISGSSFVGGLVGRNGDLLWNGDSWVSTEGGIVNNCYTTGIVTGLIEGNCIGGLVGFNYIGYISNCYSDVDIVTADYFSMVGGLVGITFGEVEGPNQSQVLNCYATGTITGGGSNISGGYGGLAGVNSAGVIRDSFSLSEISLGGEARDVGGLVGSNGSLKSIISNCYSQGTVTCGIDSSRVGGLVGNSNGRIENSYAMVSVNGVDKVGGLVGQNYYSGYPSTGNIIKCYAAGEVTGVTNTGGFTGADTDGLYVSCFWDSNVNPDVNGIGNGSDPNVIGKTTAEMKTRSTFTDAGWDFVGEVLNGPNDVWRLCEDDVNYPKLSWQFALGDFNCPDGVDVNDLMVVCEQWLLEELSADVWPDGGDGVVDFSDWASFAGGWKGTNDIDELADFAYQWLKTGANYYIADIAPAREGDGIVNMPDFAALAENWLAGL
jgi:hypothetical protein